MSSRLLAACLIWVLCLSSLCGLVLRAPTLGLSRADFPVVTASAGSAGVVAMLASGADPSSENDGSDADEDDERESALNEWSAAGVNPASCQIVEMVAVGGSAKPGRVRVVFRPPEA